MTARESRPRIKPTSSSASTAPGVARRREAVSGWRSPRSWPCGWTARSSSTRRRETRSSRSFWPRPQPTKHVKTHAVSQTSSSDYHEKLVRPGALAAVALVSAVLGGTATLVVGKAAGWIDDETVAGQTVVLPVANGDAEPANDPVPQNATKPLARNDFDAKEIYAKRSAGVVTIYALFRGHTGGADDTAAQGSGFVVSPAGYILTNSHVITTAGETAPN